MMAEDLATALQEIAGSGVPGTIDVDKARRDGRRDARHARLAAVGGSVAAVVAVAVAVSALPNAGVEAPTTATAPESSSPAASPPLDPADPIVTHWQFGYLPVGMRSIGGTGDRASIYSTTWAYTVPGDGFRMQIDPQPTEPALNPKAVAGPAVKIPAHVDGAEKAFWAGVSGDTIVDHGSDAVKDVATLYWETADGHWLALTAVNVFDRSDWQAQMLKTAGHVVHADRSVPMPIRIAAFPLDFTGTGAAVTLYKGAVSVGMSRRVGQSTIIILAFPAGKSQFWKNGNLVGAPPQAAHTCSDSNGLTLCVAVDGAEPASLTAIGGRQGLVDRITSLGADPANWTTDVLK